MIRKDLLEFKYYLDRLSMFMNESYGIQEQVEIFYQQLKTIDENFDYLLEKLDIFNISEEEYKEDLPSEILDKIGAIFGCYRKFTILLNGDYEEIELNDEDFLIYIKCQIVKQNFQGTREELTGIYTTYEDTKLTENAILDLIFVYVLHQVPEGNPPILNSVQCNIYWTNYTQYSENLRKLFLAGYLTIESVGILYNRLLRNVDDLILLGTKLLNLNNGDYYTLGAKYYIWNKNVGWRESDTPGSGDNKGEISSTNDLVNFGKFYILSGKDGDYYKIGSTYYIWNISTKEWITSSSIGSGTYWGELTSLDDLPVYMEGGFLL